MIKKYFKKIHLDSVYAYQEDFANSLPRGFSGRWLDLGCHDGKFLSFLARQVHYMGKISGVDLSSKLLKRAKMRGIEVYESDLNQRLPFAAGSFDLVTASHVIEHIEKLDIFITEIRRILNKEGILVVGTENLSAWHNVMALVCGFYPFSCDVTGQKKFGNFLSLSEGIKDFLDYHRTVFNLKTLVEFLEYYKFEIIKKTGTAYYPLPNFLGKYLSRIDSTHSVFISVLAKKF